MLKTKPSHALLGRIAIFSVIAMASCRQPTEPTTPHAAVSMRPIGPILALRMTPYRAKELRFRSAKGVRRVPESYVRWRVDSVLLEVLGDDSEGLRVRINGQSAAIEGAVPTRWQAAEIQTRLAEIDVLRGASIEWRVLDPTATVRPPPAPTAQDPDEPPPTPPSP